MQLLSVDRHLSAVMTRYNFLLFTCICSSSCGVGFLGWKALASVLSLKPIIVGRNGVLNDNLRVLGRSVRMITGDFFDVGEIRSPRSVVSPADSQDF